jgi:hypothetical protein
MLESTGDKAAAQTPVYTSSSSSSDSIQLLVLQNLFLSWQL